MHRKTIGHPSPFFCSPTALPHPPQSLMVLHGESLWKWTIHSLHGLWKAPWVGMQVQLCSPSYTAPQSAITGTVRILCSSISQLQHCSCSCAFPIPCKYFPASAEKQGLNGLRTKLLPHTLHWVLLGWVLRNKRDFKLLLSETFYFDGEIRFQSCQSGTSCQHGVYFLGQL